MAGVGSDDNKAFGLLVKENKKILYLVYVRVTSAFRCLCAAAGLKKYVQPMTVDHPTYTYCVIYSNPRGRDSIICFSARFPATVRDDHKITR